MTVFDCTTNRNARKQHECDVCGKVINTGELYNHRVTNYDSIKVEKWCEKCNPLVLQFWDKMHENGDDLYSDLWEDISEDMREVSCCCCPNKENCEIENIVSCEKCRKEYLEEQNAKN